MRAISLTATAALIHGFILIATASANQIYLVGDVVYSSSSGGANVGGGYRYGSNTADTTDYVQSLTPTAPAGTAQGQGISFQLAVGTNVFSFAPDTGVQGTGPVSPGSYAGIDLFFNSTGVSYNPAGSGSYPGDLVVFGPTATAGFAVPVSGTNVQNFQPNGTGVASYSGATSFQVGNEEVTVTAFSVNGTPSGTFTLTVTTPEPSSLILCGLGAMGLFVAVRRRRKA